MISALYHQNDYLHFIVVIKMMHLTAVNYIRIILLVSLRIEEIPLSDRKWANGLANKG